MRFLKIFFVEKVVNFLRIEVPHAGNHEFLEKDHSDSDVACPNGVSGLFAHPTDCAKFINCANGVPYVQACGPGTAYDSVKMVCDYEHKVACTLGTPKQESMQKSKFYHVPNNYFMAA